MAVSVTNLMPWREQRRLQCQHFWGRFLVFATLGITLVTVVLSRCGSVDRQSALLWLQSDAAVLTALSARQPHLQAQRKAWEQQRKHERQRDATRAWQGRLATLAKTLPDSIWLTALKYQQAEFDIEGLSHSVTALSELEKNIAATQGFRLQGTGTTMRDPQGRWYFHYRLSLEDDDDVPRP